MLTAALCTYSPVEFSIALRVFEKLSNETPEPNTVTVLLDNKTGELATMPKGLDCFKGDGLQLRVYSYTLEELEQLAERATPTDAEPLYGALMILRPRLTAPNKGFYLFAESANHIVVAPAPQLRKKARKGFA